LTDAANAWNPGLDSDIPRHLLPLVTLFREESGFVDYREASELADLTGLKVNDLVAFRPQRLVIHDLLVRVTADLSVPDGPNYEDLGISLRGMVDKIYSEYVVPEADAISALYRDKREEVEGFVTQQLSEKFFDKRAEAVVPTKAPSLLRKIFSKKPITKTTASRQLPELVAIEEWEELSTLTDNNLHKASFRALVKTVGAIVGHRGALRIDQQLVTRIVTNMASNTYIADLIHEFVEPFWEQAIKVEDYRYLPAQKSPVIMNVKGASASGKSTIRPQQRQLAGKLNIPWEDFALISPDYWRKYLLDYNSLGEDYKYSAMLTGSELEIIDKKLDRYVAGKSLAQKMPHLLIDRFRFDSFTVDIDQTADSRLLSRFGDQVYLFFMVTPPAETVTRAWLRGIETGRFKAVDDLLYHNVEAFTGMPSLFLSWINSKDREVHFEFLDNDVTQGELPRTAAFGWNGIMTILDVELMLNIDRYREVDITARTPDQVLKSDENMIEAHKGFLHRCSQKVDILDFVDRDTLKLYARVKGGRLIWWDQKYLEENSINAGVQKMFEELGYSNNQCEVAIEESSLRIDQVRESQFTVGRWGLA